MVQTHFNVGVHFVNLHVNIVFEKIIFYYFMFTIVHFIIERSVNANKRKLFTFWKKYTNITETVKSPPKNGGDFSGKKGEKRVGKTIEKFRRKCVENPPEKVKNQA